MNTHKNSRLAPERRKFIKNAFGSFMLSGLASIGLAAVSPACATRKGMAISAVGDDLTDDLSRIKSAIANKQKPLKWVFTGDSITQGAKHTLGFRSFPEIFSEHVRFELNRSRDLVINTAISGNASIDILKDFQWRVGQFDPDLVFIMAGTNDAAAIRKISVADFEANLRSLVISCRDLSAIPILNTPPTIMQDNSKSSLDRASLPAYVEAILKVAADQKVVLVDHWKSWSERSMSEVPGKFMNDSLHPNGRGHLEIAREIFLFLDICNGESFTCNGIIKF